MDLDAPEGPSPEERASYLRYKRWQERFKSDSRTRLSERTFGRYVEPPLSIAGISCIWWGIGVGAPTRPLRNEIVLVGIAVGLLPLIIRKVFRIRAAPDA
jgi:hypothetical protein